MSKYRTKQRAALLTYLSNHTDEQISAKQMAADLADEGISLSAVYRNLSDLENEGQVKRCPRSGTREAFYQYMAAKECHESLHLSCKKCGKTFHMESDEADILVAHVAKNEKFRLDKAETVLYGICENCDK